ncbi:alpha/beta hydrolase [Streptomyces calvus]
MRDRIQHLTAALTKTEADVPTLLLHGDDDQIVPIANSARSAVTLVEHVTLKVYPGLSHGMCTVNADTVNADLLDFIKS